MPAHLKKPFIIPIFIPHAGCPHHCVFCSQSQITGFTRSIPTQEEIETTLVSYLFHRPKNRFTTQVSFFGGNFLGLLPSQIHSLILAVKPYVLSGQINGIRCSTRPDTVTAETLDILEQYPVSTIELGAQSMDDAVLKVSGRGHTARDTQQAVCLLKRKKYEIGIQMMVGLPGETEHAAMLTAQKIIELAPDFVRIYPTIVLSGSLLATWRNKGRYMPMPLDRCVSLVKKIFLLFRESHIPVVRMGLQPTAQLQTKGVILDGPYHPSFGHLVYSEIFLDRVVSEHRRQGKAANLAVRVHPGSESILRGIQNGNIGILSNHHGIKKIDIIADNSLGSDMIMVNGRKVSVYI